MKLLSNIDRALSPGRSRDAQRPATAPAGERVELAGVIGERYETLHGGLDRIGGLIEQLRGLEPVLNEMRGPLQAEYDARRTDYIELVNLRTAHGEALSRGEALTAEIRALTEARDAVEQRLEDVTQRLSDQTGVAQDAQLEVDRLRTALSQSETQAQSLAETERDSSQRLRQLEQDLETVRAQLQEADTGRAEAAAGRGAAQRDHALQAEENTTLKRRIDELVTEVARLARVEASLEGQLTAERARAASDQAEAARAIQGLEGQTENGRAEGAALQVRLDTLTARADRLERLNADLTTALNEAQASAQGAERRVSHLQIDLNRGADRLRELEAQAEEGRQRIAAMDAARLAAVDRADHLSKSSTANERALSRSEARAAKLQTAMDTAKAEAEARARGLTEQIDALRSRLEGAQAESAMTAAALDAARRDRAPDRPALAAAG